jgi:hypothetical protein
MQFGEIEAFFHRSIKAAQAEGTVLEKSCNRARASRGTKGHALDPRITPSSTACAVRETTGLFKLGVSKDAGQVSLAPDAHYNAKWDACEAQARRQGTPPGTTGYVGFIEDCVRVATR